MTIKVGINDLAVSAVLYLEQQRKELTLKLLGLMT